MSAESKSTILVLETGFYDRNNAPAALRELGGNLLVTEVAANPETAKPSDWDSILQAILSHNRCITL